MKAANAARGMSRILAACWFAASAREKTACINRAFIVYLTDESMFCQTNGIDV
jgi:hypothetical protein